MGHSKSAKADSHERIVQAAAARIREAGVEATGVAELMALAGLTHGGFYRHFASREDLVAAAVERALAEGGAAVGALASSREATIGAIVDAYLSLSHRDCLATSCAVTTLAAEVARCPPPARAAYTSQVRTYIELLGGLLAAKTGKARRAQALLALSTLVGAVSLARAVDDEKLSREILKSAGEELKARLR